MNAWGSTLLAVLLACIGAWTSTAEAQPGDSAWPTLRGNPQRTGFYPRFPKSPLKLVWRQELWRELTGPRAEVVVDQEMAFLGSYAGVFRAWNLSDGQERWRCETGGAIGHSAACSQGLVFFGSMDRKFRALEALTGKQRWAFTAAEGIWVAPLVLKTTVYFGDRQGVFYALDSGTGKERWRFPTGGPILNSASASADGRRVLFVSEDMHLYCLSAEDGRLLWKSRKLPGLSARDYAPVIAGGLVFATTNPVKDFHAILDEHQRMLLARTGWKEKENRYIPATPKDIREEQEIIINFLREHPEEQTFFAFRVEDGHEPWMAPVLYTGGLHNPLTPPCVNPVTGEVFLQVRSAYGVWDGGGEVRPFTGVGKLDLVTGRIELLEHAHKSTEGGRPAGRKDMPWSTFNTIGDETQTLGCTPDLLLSVHQGFIGSLHLRTGLTANLYGKRDTYGGFYGPGNFGWESQGGLEKAVAAGQPYGLLNEWHGPARGLIAVSENRVLFHVGSQVICLEGGD